MRRDRALQSPYMGFALTGQPAAVPFCYYGHPVLRASHPPERQQQPAKGLCMKSLSIRNLPDDVYDALKAMAKANHRSLQGQVRCLIEHEIRLLGSAELVKAREWRARLAQRNLGDTVRDVREDRERSCELALE